MVPDLATSADLSLWRLGPNRLVTICARAGNSQGVRRSWPLLVARRCSLEIMGAFMSLERFCHLKTRLSYEVAPLFFVKFSSISGPAPNT